MQRWLLGSWCRLRGALLVGLGLLLGGRGNAQSGPTLDGVFAFTKPGRHQSRVPFLSPRNLIIISARLNGQGPFNFLLDTGVASSLLTNPQLADSLGLGHGTEYRLQGVGGVDSGLRAYEASHVRVGLPGVEAASTTWLVLSNDVLDLSGYVGLPVQGIIGSDLFRSFVVAIHPEQRELLLSAPSSYKAPRGRRWASLPLAFDHEKAYVTVGVQQLGAAPTATPLALRLLLDTGAGHALSLETTADHRLRLPAQRLRTDLGRGLSGVVSGSMGRVASVQLGRYYLPQVLTSFPDSTQVHERLSSTERGRHGSLGYEVLKRFTTVIDYPHGRLLLRPTAALHEPFEHDMCGLDLLATGPSYRQYMVLRVAPNSPASLVGISEGEELIAINLMPTQYFSITDLNHMLHSQDGRVLLLLLRRSNGELHSTTVKLKRQI